MAAATQQKLTPELQAKLQEACRRSLYYLCTGMLGYQDWDIVHDDLEKFLVRPSAKKAIVLPRGHLKTSIVTVAKTIQVLLNNPNARVLIANQIWDMSRSFLSEIKEQLEKSQLKYIFGDFVSARWNADEIILRQRTKPLKEPSIKTTGVEAEQTGGHFDFIILDDLTGLQNSATQEQREKTKRFRRSMVNLLEPSGKIIDIGTRWHLDDTFSVIFEKEYRYYDIMVRKVVENGKIIFPKHFSKKFDDVRKDWVAAPEANCMDYIEHLKASMPIDEFCAQYMNDPISSENQLFKQEMFKYWNRRPDGLYVAMTIDLAISQVSDADKTAIVIVGMSNDRQLYLLDYLRGQWTPSQIVDKVFEMQSRWQPFAIGMEVNGFQRTLKIAVEQEMHKRKQFFGIDEIRNGPDKSKENRIKSLEPFYRDGRVHHALWMKGKNVEIELLTFPKGRHDDIIDAMAMALPLLSPGGEAPQPEMKPGTWEYVEREARRAQHRYNGFFDYGY